MHAWGMAWLDAGLGGVAALMLGARSPSHALWLAMAGACGSSATRLVAFGAGTLDDPWDRVLGMALVSLTGAVALAAVFGLLALWLGRFDDPHNGAQTWPQAAPGRRR